MEGRQKPVKNELFTIGPLTVYGYGAMIALGVIAAWIVTECRARKLRLSSDHVFALVLWGLLGGIVCAKLLYWITEWDSVMKDPGFLLDTLTDGFVVYGGIIGGILAGWIYCRAKKINFWAYFDLVMPSVALAQGFGRIGCLLAGCCYGKETDSILAITFHESEFAPNNVPLIPTEIYSSLLDFVHFGVLLFIAGRKKKEIYSGVFPGRSDPRKRWSTVNFSVYQPVYRCSRNPDSNPQKQRKSRQTFLNGIKASDVIRLWME